MHCGLDSTYIFYLQNTLLPPEEGGTILTDSALLIMVYDDPSIMLGGWGGAFIFRSSAIVGMQKREINKNITPASGQYQ